MNSNLKWIYIPLNYLTLISMFSWNEGLEEQEKFIDLRFQDFEGVPLNC
jgi:hypothetical protein